MPPTFDICIDEAGDDGFSFNKNEGCSQWLIQSACVYPKCNLGSLNEALRKVKAEIGWQDAKPLHFRKVRGGNRSRLIQALVDSQALFRAVIVMVHKPSLESQEVFSERHRLYFYMLRILLERASWVCRDSRSIRDRSLGDGTANVIFSNRSDISYQEVAGYFNRLERLETTIDFNVIRPGQFEALTNGKKSGLQVADALASAFFCAEHTFSRCRSCDHAQALAPTLYRRNGKAWGYGLKFFPPSIEKQAAQGTVAPWAAAFQSM